MPDDNAAFQAIDLDSANVASACAGYPFAVRQAFRLATQLKAGQLELRMPDGRAFMITGDRPGPKAVMMVRDLDFAGSLAQGDVGVAESYLRGQWDSPDLTAFLELFCVNQPFLERLLDGKPVVRLMQMAWHWMNRNTRAGSKRNIHAHYDLGNSFYGAWLDDSMTYSSALFDQSRDLAAGQQRKYAALAERTAIGPDHHVLEIGCGWGGFAEYAAREIGCKVTGLTISQEQYDFACKRIFEAGLNEKVDLKLQDYRDEKGAYDRIASIEMFEAVGEEYWSTYFQQVRERLKPGGFAGIQVITIEESLFARYRRELDFIRRYVFPGGMLPTVTIMRDLGAKVGLTLHGERAFGHDYAHTLVHWRERFRAAWPGLTPLGFDERFRRLWEYYLAYCEAGFRAGTIDVRQMVFARG
jgi:cyclopropane-fatty-acyl-phospholipid synthase